MMENLHGSEKISKEKEVSDLIKAVNMMSIVHYEAYLDYMKITEGDKELSIKLSNGMIQAVLRMGNKENE